MTAVDSVDLTDYAAGKLARRFFGRRVWALFTSSKNHVLFERSIALSPYIFIDGKHFIIKELKIDCPIIQDIDFGTIKAYQIMADWRPTEATFKYVSEEELLGFLGELALAAR